MATKKFRIIGRIINRETQQGVAGLRVEAWDKDTFFNDLVGRAVTAESGDFHIEFSEAHYKESFLDRHPDLFFKVFRGEELIHSTEDDVLWNVKTEKTEVLIEVDSPATQPESFVVKGKVRQADGRPLAGAIVHAFDRDMRFEQLVGRTTADAAGGYHIAYARQQFCRLY